MNFGIIVLVFASLLAACGSAQSFPKSLEIANPNPIGSGARAMAMANAFIAVADDATAASWNPAGLAQLVRPEMSFALEGIYATERSRTQPSSTEHFDLADFTYASFVMPLPGGYGDKHKNLVFSLSQFSLFRFDKSLDLSFNFLDPLVHLPVKGTYQLENEGTISAFTPATGFVISEHISFGLSMNILHHSVTQNSIFKKTEFVNGEIDFTGGDTFPANSLLDKNTFSVEEGFSFVLGVLYQPSAKWSFAAVLKPNYDLKLKHERVVVDFGGQIPATILSQKVNAELEFPWVIGLGLVWESAVDRWKISGDITWTDWSRYEFRERGIRSNPLQSGTSKRLDDTYTVRVGSEYLLDRPSWRIPLRWGIGYDPSPKVRGRDDFYTLSAGTGFQYPGGKNPKCQFDIAYEFRWGKGVNQGELIGFDTNNRGQDVKRSRLQVSLIYYF